MTSLGLAAAFWILIHAVVAGPLRASLIAWLGEGPYRGLFSLLSAIGLVWLIVAYGGAPYVELWAPGAALAHVPLLVMPIAVFLLTTGMTTRSPMAVGMERLEDWQAIGILRVTRHPGLWAFALWAAAHIVANGDVAGLFLFVAILVVALNGMASIDRKRAAADPAKWQQFAAATSRLPFAAIVAGRNRFVFAEIGWWRLGLAVVIYVALILLHPYFAGVAVLPG
jgi:uncharacterized membrane protein